MLYPGMHSIIWTKANPAYKSVIYRSEPGTLSGQQFYPVAEDINKLQGWIEREIELSKIRNYRQNWDGFDADAPDPTIMDTAILFLRNLRGRANSVPPERVALSPNGSVTLDWLEGDNFRRAEIENPYQVDWMLVTPGQGTEFSTEYLSDLTPSAGAGQTWQPAPAPVDEPAFVSAH